MTLDVQLFLEGSGKEISAQSSRMFWLTDAKTEDMKEIFKII